MYIQSEEIYKVERNGHKYNIGETKILIGLEGYSKYNGQKVLITAFRANGEYGLCYYVKGEINEDLNWVYEYRLRDVEIKNYDSDIYMPNIGIREGT